MRLVLLAAVAALGLAGFTGCGESAPPTGGGVQAPPPEDSGADKDVPQKGGRLPAPSK